MTLSLYTIMGENSSVSLEIGFSIPKMWLQALKEDDR
jgi:hypothetical protein